MNSSILSFKNGGKSPAKRNLESSLFKNSMFSSLKGMHFTEENSRYRSNMHKHKNASMPVSPKKLHKDEFDISNSNESRVSLANVALKGIRSSGFNFTMQ